MKLEKYINIINGYPFSSREFNLANNGYPIIKIKELKQNGICLTKDTCYVPFKKELETYILNKDDILIALTGNPPNKGNFDAIVGRCSIYNIITPAFLNQRVCKIYSISSKLLNKYLYYFLSLDSTIFELASKCSGSANQANISSNDIKNIEIVLPSIYNQQHIVNTIGSVDDLIENIDNQNKQLYKLIEVIFSNLSESKIKLCDICEIKYGKAIEASKLSKEERYLVYGGNGVIGTLDTYAFDEAKIAISCRGAASGNVILTTPYSTISSNSLYLNLKSNKNLLPLYSYLLRSDLKKIVTGSAQPQITIENIKSLNVPDFNEIKNLNYNIITDIINLNGNKLLKLRKIKQILLKKYFTNQ